MGMCEYAIGRGGSVGDDGVGQVRLDEGEEDARLLGGDDDDFDLDHEDGERGENDQEMGGDERENEEDHALRTGRLILRQFHHNSYHLHNRLTSVMKGNTLREGLTESELKELIGKKWTWGDVRGSQEGKFWSDLAMTWGLVLGDE